MNWFFLILASGLFACTDFVVECKDGSLVNGRSLEFALDLKSEFQIFAKNKRHSSMAPNHSKGIEWVSKYGFVGVVGIVEFPFDGLNEAGLSVGYLWLPGVTSYPTVPADQMSKALDFVDLGAWILGNFATVEEVKKALSSVFIWGHSVPPIGVTPVHLAIHDAQGKNLVIEFIDGKTKVYDNPTTVLTNSPPFDWQLANLQNYLNLSPNNPSTITLKGFSISPPGQGTGLLGLPGDFSPPSRFVKISTFLRFAAQASSSEEGVILAAHLLNSVDIPLGTVRDTGKMTGDYTQWIVIKDLFQKRIYFRSYKDMNLKVIDLKKIDFLRGMKNNLSVNLQKGYFDATPLMEAKKETTVMSEPLLP